ncbi:DMT family transporter [Burkholderia gladioli]|uniref:EamA-like transporter family protein n=1 Tax=Burkholderia gladioli (strain BSR3) TaxID=999541 RepID=F2LMD5_BURGS|nr:DMT family transporter [Burkholderia gladioli]AEA64219.1 hypothetical protein bgla_2g17810 [Burkholderia gladioli BSR3]MBW5286943.1 DMT family transporter [Burkholderia gladioli]
MILSISVALLNGLVIGTSRAVNGQLSTCVGPFRASLVNHVVGFLFLSLLLVFQTSSGGTSASAPAAAYLGGVFGALFVAVSSYVFPRLGAMKAALLVISGQMLAAVVIDWHHHQAAPGALRCLGVAIVLLGIVLSKLSDKHSRRKTS